MIGEPPPTSPSASEGEGTAARGWAARASWRGLGGRVLLGVGIGVVLVVVSVGAWIFPYYRDDRVLDKVVREVVMDWRDFGEARARARLEYELDRKRIGAWVSDDACQLSDAAGIRRVDCAWRVEVAVPGTTRRLPLGFRSTASLRPDGSVRP